MTNIEHYFENCLGNIVKGIENTWDDPLNTEWMTKEEIQAVRYCVQYVAYVLFPDLETLKEIYNN